MTETPLQKTAITLCGSLRKDAINEVLRRHMSKKLREAGVEVFSGSDNIRDLWSPYGNGDMLERARLIGYRQNFRRDEEMLIALDLVTEAGRRATGLGGGDTTVEVAAETIPEAIATCPPRMAVWRGARRLA